MNPGMAAMKTLHPLGTEEGALPRVDVKIAGRILQLAMSSEGSEVRIQVLCHAS